MTGLRCLALATVACLPAAALRASDCTKTSMGFTPLDDLGPGTYQGMEGGLYPGGTRLRPAAHDLLLDRAGRIQLLDAAGNPDPVGGRIVLLSIGMSNTTQEFQVFKPRADADPQKNSLLVIVDGAQGGQDARIISDPLAAFWTNVDQRLAAAGVTPAQVQSVWLKQARAGPTETFPADADALRDNLRAIVQIIKSRYPSTQSVYLSSRIYAGYADTALNPEPYAYQSGFAVKGLVDEQIQGLPAVNFDPLRGPVLAPWLAWGPYLWADGLVPRSDGLIWECADFNADGTHPAASGRSKVADLLLAFFKSDPTTIPWFLDCDLAEPGTFGAPPEARDLVLVKLPGGAAELRWTSLDPVVGPAAVYDVVSGSLLELRADGGFGGAQCLATDIADTPYAESAPAPAPGDAVWFRVRGRNSCARGTWGDPGITVACP